MGPENAKSPRLSADVEVLVDEHQNALIRYAFRLLHNRELAQDVVQEAFLRYLKKPLAYGEPRQRASWLYRVTHNLCIDLIKRESKRGEIYTKLQHPDIERLPIAEIMATERWDRLGWLLERLSKNQRTVILLFFQEGLSYKEIAEITELSMSNVGMLLHRGLKRLRTIIEEERLFDL